MYVRFSFLLLDFAPNVSVSHSVWVGVCMGVCVCAVHKGLEGSVGRGVMVGFGA